MESLSDKMQHVDGKFFMLEDVKEAVGRLRKNICRCNTDRDCVFCAYIYEQFGEKLTK